MRITKKFTGDNKLGKIEYRASGLPLGARLEAELRTAEANFHTTLIGDGSDELKFSIFPCPGLQRINDIANDEVSDYAAMVHAQSF